MDAHLVDMGKPYRAICHMKYTDNRSLHYVLKWYIKLYTTMLIDKVIIHNYVDRQSLHIKTVARQMTNINIHVRYTFFRITFFPFTKKIKVDFNLSIFLFLQVHLDRKYSDLD